MPGWYAEARKELKTSISKRLRFRTVADDGQGTVYQISYPPHGRRMRWINADWSGRP